MFLSDFSILTNMVSKGSGPLCLGFFSLGSAPGNQGMLDQVLALKWVQSHIHAFAGDSKNVTLMGESAGAMSTLLHFVSPLSQGLFHKIISFSGTPSTPFLHIDRKPNCYARTFSKHLLRKKLTSKESNDISDEDLLNRMRDVSAKTITENSCFFKDWDVS